MKLSIINCQLSILLLFLASCQSEEQAFEPGPSVGSNCQQVHFDDTNESVQMLFANESERSVTYTLTRSSDKGALTVPVRVMNATQGLELPSEINFADGDTTATYVVSTPLTVEEGTSFNFEVQLEGDNANPYTEGAVRFSSTISFPKPKWGRMWFTGMVETLGYFLQNFYDLGNGSLLVPDFMQSGTDLWVRYDASATSTVECDLQTSPSFFENDESNAGCYYLYCWDENKDENDGYTLFYPHGPNAKVYIKELVLYVSHDGYNATVYNPVTGSGWLQLSTVWFSDKTSESSWKFLNWVFTDDPENDGYDYEEPDPTSLPTGTILDCTGKFNYDDFGLGKFSQQAKVLGKNYVQFADFLGSGVELRMRYNADTKLLDITCDKGYVEDGIFYLRDKESGQWINCYPTGNKAVNLAIKLSHKDNLIEYQTKNIKFYCPTFLVDGKKKYDGDDLIKLTW